MSTKKEKLTVDFLKKSGRLLCSAELLKLIRNKFSIFNPSYIARRFSPRKYVITPAGAFEIGMWDEINRYLTSLNIPLTITLTDEFKKHYKPVIAGIKDIATIDGFDYYDYQEATLKEFISNGRGISIIPTAGGKTLILAGLCKMLIEHKKDAKILIIVPNVGLLNQTYFSFIDEFNITCVERWGDENVPLWNTNIIIANSQILLSSIPYTLSKVKNYDAVIVDEVHRLGEKKNQINKIVHNMTTPNRFGLTGTLPDNKLAAWNAIGKIGPILYEKSSYEIRQQGTISNVEVKILYCKHKTRPPDPEEYTPTAFYDEEFKFIIDHSKRNQLIKKLTEKVEGNVLVVVDRLKYGELLDDLLKCDNKEVFFIRGNTDTDERTRIQKLMDTRNGIICIAMSTIFSTGISIKNLHAAIFTYMGMSNVKIIQSIGRTLRKHESKDKAIIYDIGDSLKYSRKHLKKRIELYKKDKIEFTIKEINI